MDSVFPVDDITDGFWSPHGPPIGLHDDADVSSAAAVMNRSSSEWAFQRFLQEVTSPHQHTTTLQSDGIVDIKTNHHNQPQPPPPVASGEIPQNIPTDPEKYQAFLKSRLELACAAVALTRATNGMARESAAATAEIGSQVSNSSSSTANGRDSSKMDVKDFGGAVGVTPLPAFPRKSMVQVRSTTSGSSGDQSDDDEVEGETEDTQNTDPADTKRMRRMLSNRESARRSRRRKQVNLTERETQVSQLRLENSSLLKCLTETNQKYNESAVDNRVLKADLETLRAKVKMAEESVKRVTGLNSLFHAMPSFSHSPIQDDPTQHYYHSVSNNHFTNHRIQNDFVEIPRAENLAPNVAAAIPESKMEKQGTSSSGS